MRLSLDELPASGNGYLKFVHKTTGTMVYKTSTYEMVDDTWYHIALTWDGSLNSSGINLYVDGALTGIRTSGDGTGTLLDDSTGDFIIGNTPDGTRGFWGVMDETRISKATRSADWIEASFLSQNGTFTFNTFGAEQTVVITTDKAAPVVLAKETADLNSDGFIDAIHVTFSEAIQDSSVNDGDWDVAGVGGETFVWNANGDTANDADIYITFGGTLDTGATPTLTYLGNSPTDADVADLSGNLMAGAWWDTNWLNRSQISFDNSNSAEDLVDFPVLVTLNTTNLPGLDLSAVVGSDVRFTDSNTGAELNYEVESWDAATDTAMVWVKVPKILAGSVTDSIHVYYNFNGAATYDQSAAHEQAVWASNYQGVFHLGEDQVGVGNVGVYRDSTANANDGDDEVSDTGKSGQIGQGQEFDDVDDYHGWSGSPPSSLNKTYTDLDGEFYKLKQAAMEPKPIQSPLPVWFGGHKRRGGVRVRGG